jgi:peptidoglycan hydrolase CwlO-like protein
MIKIRLLKAICIVMIICSLLLQPTTAVGVLASEDDSLEGQTNALQELLYNLNQDLDEIGEEIANTVQLIEDANASISYATYQLANTQKEKEEQIEAMHSRIKLIYEMDNASLVELLFSAESMTEVLNIAEFIQNINNYDRMMVLELQETHDSIERFRDRIETEEVNLVAYLEELDSQRVRLEEEAEATATDLTAFNIQMSVIQGDIAEAHRLLETLDVDISSMEITYEARLLAAIIHTEARGECFVGQIAVGNVVMNRLKHPNFADTIEGVIRQPGQFCPVRDGSFDMVLSNGNYRHELRAAMYVLAGHATVTSDILFFNSLGFGTLRIGNHWFRTIG